MTTSEPRQLTLPVALRPEASFANLVAGRNAALIADVSSLGQEGGEPRVYVWGPVGSGRSHVLQAACRAIAESGARVAYLGLADRNELSPVMLESLEDCALVCLDDIDAVAGDATWEHALFDFYNRAAASGCALLMAALAAPSAAAWTLPDLRSRLSASLVYRMEPLTDDEKCCALQQRAQERGMELSDEAARYLLRHVKRDTQSLFAVLERLDTVSLIEQRRLTVPFIKQVIES